MRANAKNFAKKETFFKKKCFFFWLERNSNKPFELFWYNGLCLRWRNSSTCLTYSTYAVTSGEGTPKLLDSLKKKTTSKLASANNFRGKVQKWKTTLSLMFFRKIKSFNNLIPNLPFPGPCYRIPKISVHRQNSFEEALLISILLVRTTNLLSTVSKNTPGKDSN